MNETPARAESCMHLLLQEAIKHGAAVFFDPGKLWPWAAKTGSFPLAAALAYGNHRQPASVMATLLLMLAHLCSWVRRAALLHHEGGVTQGGTRGSVGPL